MNIIHRPYGMVSEGIIIPQRKRLSGDWFVALPRTASEKRWIAALPPNKRAGRPGMEPGTLIHAELATQWNRMLTVRGVKSPSERPQPQRVRGGMNAQHTLELVRAHSERIKGHCETSWPCPWKGRAK